MLVISSSSFRSPDWYSSTIRGMSWNGSPDPNRLPWMRFSNRVRIAPGSSMVFLVGSASPVTTTVPPLRIALNAFVTTSESTTPTVTMALSAPTPGSAR